MVHDTTESRGYKIAVFVVSAIFVGVSIANIVYYNRLRKETTADPPVSTSEANVMMWVNIITLVIAGLIFLWSLWRLFFTRESRVAVKQYVTSPEHGARTGFKAPLPAQYYAPVARTQLPVGPNRNVDVGGYAGNGETRTEVAATRSASNPRN